MIYFLQSYCKMLPSQALVQQYLGRPTTWPVLLRLMYHQLSSGCTPVMALQWWPAVVTSQWKLRKPLTLPLPSLSHSTLCTHHMEDSTPASQQLTHLHQQWMPQQMWLSKVSVYIYTCDAQYMQLHKFTRNAYVCKAPSLLLWGFYDHRNSYSCPKALQKTVT